MIERLFDCKRKQSSATAITMFQKRGGYIHTQSALDFKLNLDVIARKDTFQTKLSIT